MRHEGRTDQVERSMIRSTQSGSCPALQRPGQPGPTCVAIAPGSTSSNTSDPCADEGGGVTPPRSSLVRRNERALSLPSAPALSPRPRTTYGSGAGTPPAHRDSPRQLPPVTEGRQERNAGVKIASRPRGRGGVDGLRRSSDLRMSDLGLPFQAAASNMGLIRRPSAPNLVAGTRLARRPSGSNLDAGNRRKSVPQKMHLSSGSLFYTDVIRRQVMRDVEEQKRMQEAGVDIN